MAMLHVLGSILNEYFDCNFQFEYCVQLSQNYYIYALNYGFRLKSGKTGLFCSIEPTKQTILFESWQMPIYFIAWRFH